VPQYDETAYFDVAHQMPILLNTRERVWTDSPKIGITINCAISG